LAVGKDGYPFDVTFPIHTDIAQRPACCLATRIRILVIRKKEFGYEDGLGAIWSNPVIMFADAPIA
jgi:hypothetical protein